MTKQLIQFIVVCGLSLLGSAPSVAEDFLPPNEAFPLKVSAPAADRLSVQFNTVKGYYLYRDRIKIKLIKPDSVVLGAPQFPPSETKDDPNFGSTQVYHAPITIGVPLTQKSATAAVTLEISSQGCAEAGICYPPEKQTITVNLPGAGQAASTSSAQNVPNGSTDTSLNKSNNIVNSNNSNNSNNSDNSNNPNISGSANSSTIFGKIASGRTDSVPATEPVPAGAKESASAGDSAGQPAAESQPTATTTAPAPSDDESGDIFRRMQQSGFMATLLLFFIAGLGLALTPCVYPMTPILLSILVGQGKTVTTKRSFILSFTYVQGMALTFALAGVAAGLLGGLLSQWLQNPWVLGATALFIVIFAGSMFGFYDIALPSQWQTKLTQHTDKLGRGLLLSVFALGAVSALIVGPCVAPPLFAALLYISKTHDVVLGGAALFCLAQGMGVPLLIAGMSAGSLLPRAGAWMKHIKQVFGVILMLLALWIIGPFLPQVVIMLLLATMCLVCALELSALTPLPHDAKVWRKTGKVVGLVLLIYGVALFWGGLSGHRSLLFPLADAAGVNGSAQQASPSQAMPNQPNQPNQTNQMYQSNSAQSSQAHPQFRLVKTLAELAQVRTAAKNAQRPLLIDYYADWCVSCREMEQFTFADPQVAELMQKFDLIRIDVTQNSADDQALLREYDLFGPPAIMFYQADGTLSQARVVGFMKAAEFKQVLQRLLP